MKDRDSSAALIDMAMVLMKVVGERVFASEVLGRGVGMKEARYTTRFEHRRYVCILYTM